MITKDDIIAVGKFQKTHALKGELNMITEIDGEYFKAGHPIIINYDGIYVPFYIESLRSKGSTTYLVKLRGVDSGDEASEFVNKEIFILKKDSEDWIEDDFVDNDFLEGYLIIDENDNEIGKVSYVDDSTSNVLLIVEKDNNTLYIPLNDELVEEVDEENKRIKMHIPEGLLDINEK